MKTVKSNHDGVRPLVGVSAVLRAGSACAACSSILFSIGPPLTFRLSVLPPEVFFAKSSRMPRVKKPFTIHVTCVQPTL